MLFSIKPCRKALMLFKFMKKALVILLILGIFGGSAIAPVYTRVAFAQNPQPQPAPQPQPSRTPVTNNDKPIVDEALDSFACDGLTDWTVQGCLIWGAYYILFMPAVLLARFFGYLMDSSIIFSVSSTSYDNSNPFIQNGWTIIRDLSNIFFIFALLVAAIGTIVGLHGVNAKKTIASVIIVGLFINFSLFFSKVIVDLSHVMTRVFYSNIQTIGDSKKISGALMKQLEPQKILSEAKWKDAKLHDPTQTGTQVVTVTDSDNKGTKAIITLLIAGAMNWILVYLFAVLTAVFITRVLTIWLCMIFAPLAFSTLMVPKMSHMQYIGFSSWLKNLTNAAFLAPIFLFFIFIIMKFLTVLTPLVSGGTASNWFSDVLKTVFPFVVIIGLLLAAKKITVKMSGAIGEGVAGAAAGAAKMAAGAAVGIYTGGATMALGGAGARVAGSSKLANMEASGGIKGTAAGLLRGGGKMLSTNSLDWRSTAAGKGIAKSMGIETSAPALSYEDRRKAFRKKKQDEMKGLEVNEDEPVMKAMRQWRQQFGGKLIEMDHQIEEAKKDVKENGTRENKQKLADLKTERSLFKEGKKLERDTAGNIVRDPVTQKTKAVPITDPRTGRPVNVSIKLGNQNLNLKQLEDKKDHINEQRREAFATTVQRTEILGMKVPSNWLTRATGIRNRNRDIAADDLRRHNHTEFNKKKEAHEPAHHPPAGGGHDEPHDDGHGGGAKH